MGNLSRKKIKFDFGWRFAEGDLPQASEKEFDDSGWKEIDLPHDWSRIDLFFKDNKTRRKGGYASDGFGWLQKSSILDNKSNHLVMDNIAALHGLVSYEYIYKTLNDPLDAEWAWNELVNLNRCLNQTLYVIMNEKNVDWDNACFSFGWKNSLLSGPG